MTEGLPRMPRPYADRPFAKRLLYDYNGLRLCARTRIDYEQ